MTYLTYIIYTDGTSKSKEVPTLLGAKRLSEKYFKEAFPKEAKTFGFIEVNPELLFYKLLVQKLRPADAIYF